ncbi:D-glycerate 2-kinase [bacterium HR36]|nr:D-glycerate 2-kinase [bacterium HR36]
MAEVSRALAEAIWRAGVQAAQPQVCLPQFLRLRVQQGDPRFDFSQYERLLVVGAGKAGSAMSAALEKALLECGVDLRRVTGWVNVPKETVQRLQRIHLHAARPMGINEPTSEAMFGAERILELVSSAGAHDMLICLISGGGSALLPLPVEGITLAEKQQVVRLLHRSGATIQEMNAVRKHLSCIKGGWLAQRFTGRVCLTLIISDVIGDPLDVIASGPTAPDPTTFADAWAVLEKYRLLDEVPASVRNYLKRGLRGEVPETPKTLPTDEHGQPRVHHFILASNRQALEAAAQSAASLGFEVLSLGPYIEGETRQVAEEMAQQARRWREHIQRPLAVLSGGETTVTLPPHHGKGGRNQEFALAFLNALANDGLAGMVLLAAGTDGEDGPTDAAGAFADTEACDRARQLGLDAHDFLQRHDAYTFFERIGALFRPGLTQTNVMDLRVLLLQPQIHERPA